MLKDKFFWLLSKLPWEINLPSAPKQDRCTWASDPGGPRSILASARRDAGAPAHRRSKGHRCRSARKPRFVWWAMAILHGQQTAPSARDPLTKPNPDIPQVWPGTVDHENTGVTATRGEPNSGMPKKHSWIDTTAARDPAADVFQARYRLGLRPSL
jgi:hypothetical protein